MQVRSEVKVLVGTLLIGMSLAFSQTSAPPYRIHCGGDAFHSPDGHYWEADGHFTGGQPFSTTADITGTDAMALYKTERWNDPAGENLKYSFDVPEGDYTVRLHFAEIFDGDFAVGARVFDVAINDAKVLENLDVFAEVGANVALVKEFTAAPVGGKINIQLFNKVHHAKIDGIEILGAPKARATTVPYRILAGSVDDYTDAEGNLWEADSHYSGGAVFYSDVPVSGTTMPVLYQSERWYNPDQEPLVYTFDAPEGTYLVKLHFAEIFFAGAGERVFDVSINGDPVLQSLDLAGTAGQGVAVDKEFTANSINGIIKIGFGNITDHAKISAIEILEAVATNTHGVVKTEGQRLRIEGKGTELAAVSTFPGAYSLVLRDTRGTRLAGKSGFGSGETRFTGLRPGVYILEAQAAGRILLQKVSLIP